MSNEHVLIPTGSIQAVCASLHHVSNILSDQVGELTNKALPKKSSKHLYIFLITRYASFMQVLSFVQRELAQVPKDGFTDILVKDSKAQEFRRSWTTAVNNAEIIFENVNILNRDIQVRFQRLRFRSFRVICSHLILNSFLHLHRSISTCCSKYPANGNVFHIA